jgi:hypothetical protein
MPEYYFRNKKTDEHYYLSMKISERDPYLAANPDVEQLVHGAPMIGTSTLTRKPDSAFRDVLKSIKRRNRGSTVNSW